MSIQERTPPDNYGAVEQPHLEQPSRKCCKIKYKVRYFYSKGAFLVLFWITLISVTVAYYGNNFFGIVKRKIHTKATIIMILPLFICIPIIGWLADAKLGNYKLFKAGTVLLFTAVLCSVVISQISNQILFTVNIVLISSLEIIGVAACGISALQLGLDQMPDASADNITSFIAWFACSISVGVWGPSTLLDIIESCANISQDNAIYQIVVDLMAPVCMTITCCTVFILTPRCLVVEPESPKALKTIYQVLKFAAKHKAPLNRSAFTYWEEDIPSRLDLGKSRYGGPFTTEQVEDVKAFFKIIIMLTPGYLIFSALFSGMPITYHLHTRTLKDSDSCFSHIQDAFVTNSTLSVIVLIAVYELCIYPFIRNRIPTTLKRIAIGSFFILLIQSSFLVEAIVNFNSTQPAMANSRKSHLADLLNQEAWANIVLTTLQSLVVMFLMNGLLEFVCAQSPYNMRGLLTGCTVFSIITSFAVSVLIDMAIRLLINLFATDYKDICHKAVTTILSLIGFILHCVLAHWYRRRVRDEDYPVHRVVEEVYDRYLSHVH